MKTIVITTQAELDALPGSFYEFTYIEIRSPKNVELVLTRTYSSASVRAYDSASVRAYDSASVRAYDSASVRAYDSASVTAHDSASVTAHDSASVTAHDSASVRAYDSASVRAYDSASVHNYSELTSIDLFSFAVAILVIVTKKIKKRSETTTVIRPKKLPGTNAWLDRHGILLVEGFVTLFKRVSKDLETQENNTNRTVWGIGATLTVPNWNPTESECGEGKFHACPEPFFCDEFRDTVGDRYVVVKVAVKDLYAWDGARFPHKIAFRSGVVMHECDKRGKVIP